MCMLCDDPEREAIDKMLERPRSVSRAVRSLKVSRTLVRNHMIHSGLQAKLEARRLAAREAALRAARKRRAEAAQSSREAIVKVLSAPADPAEPKTMLEEMRLVQRRAWLLLENMSGDGDHRGAVLALRECREVLTSLDGMMRRAAEATGAMAITVVDAGSQEYCPWCPHCAAPKPKDTGPRGYIAVSEAPFPPPGCGKLMP